MEKCDTLSNVIDKFAKENKQQKHEAFSLGTTGFERFDNIHRPGGTKAYNHNNF